MPSVKRGLQRELDAVPVVDTDKPDTGAQFVHCVSGAYARVFLPVSRHLDLRAA